MSRLAILVLCVCAVAHAAPHSGLQLDSATPSASVHVDGKRVGLTPLVNVVPLAPGEHTIKVTRKGFAPYIDVFQVQKKRVTKVSVELVPVAAILNVASNIAGASVFVDGKFVGQAPITGVEMEVGDRQIRVQKGGYKDYLKKVPGVAGQEIVLDAELEELPIGENPYKPLPQTPPKWYEKWWVWTIVVGGAAVVVTAIAVPSYVYTRDHVRDFHPDATVTGNY